MPPLQVAAGTQLYSVRPYGAKEGEAPLTVARSLLRHRKVHTKAIFGITDDKKHERLLRCAVVHDGDSQVPQDHVH